VDGNGQMWYLVAVEVVSSAGVWGYCMRAGFYPGTCTVTQSFVGNSEQGLFDQRISLLTCAQPLLP